MMKQFQIRQLVPIVAVAFAVLSAGSLAGCTGNPAPAASSPTAVSTVPAGVAADPTNSATTAATAAATAAATGQPAPTPEPARTVPVPAPSGGSVDQVIPPAAAGPVTKADLDKTAVLPNKVSITVSKVAALDTKATTPGEIAGPAVALTVSIHNGSTQAINADSAMVTLTDSNNVPGQPTTSDPYLPFAGDLAAGESTEGIYVFLMPTTSRTGLTLSVEYAAGQASAQFVGDSS